MRSALGCHAGKAKLILSLTQEFEAIQGMGPGLWPTGDSQTFLFLLSLRVTLLLSQPDLGSPPSTP